MRQSKRNKTKIIATISLALILVFSGIFTILPAIFAQTTLPGYTPMPDRPTQTEVAVSPDFCGVGQEVTINIITYPGPSGPTYEAQYLVPGGLGGFSNISITIIHPNGDEETFMPIDETIHQRGIDIPGQAQIVGHLQFRYTPTEEGIYSFTGSFPGQFYTTDNVNPTSKLSVYYLPSSSTKPATLTVQQDKVIESGLLTGWPWQPLPENYWEDPVQTNNREWYEVSGDWLQNGWDTAASKYNPFSTAPNSPHIIWTRELWRGGLGGGIWGSLPYMSASYSSSSPIVMDGNIYMNGRKGYFYCVDLRTGEKLWEAQGTIDKGMTGNLAYQTESQEHEGWIDRWLWGGTRENRYGSGSDKWYMYDPLDGDLVRTITNVPKDLTGIKMQDGSPEIYVVQADLNTWNTTKPLKLSYVNLIKWDLNKMVTTRIYSNIFSNDWRDGMVWNVSCQTGDGPGGVDVGDNNFRGPEPFVYYGANVVVVKTPNAMQHAVGFDMTTGALLWTNYNMVHDIDVRYEGVATGPSGPLIKQNSGAPEWVAYDVVTGQEIWRASTGEKPWSALPCYLFIYHDGVHFLGSYDGHVYAYDADTGQQVWVSDYLGDQWENIYGHQSFAGYNTAGADGKLYFATGTVYRAMPRSRFHETVCIDESTGDFIWRLPIQVQAVAIVDGYLLGYDEDNGIMYTLGKGKTETTVEIQNDVVAAGSSVLIKGTVMDMSPGAPNTPAVSDADMSIWMDYLYGQNATLINEPPSPDGVPVNLFVVKPDGTEDWITTVSSDSYGNYAHVYTPQTEGIYKVIAKFEGSESYWNSYAETELGVVKAPSPGEPLETEEPSTPPPSEEPTTEVPTTEEPTTTPPTELPSEEAPFPTTEVVIVAAVAVAVVVGVGAYWALRRRK